MSHKTKQTAKLIAAVVLLMGWQLSVRAAEGGEDKWQFITAPHLWAAGIEGDVTIKGMTALHGPILGLEIRF